jgi:hypothetical protein
MCDRINLPSAFAVGAEDACADARAYAGVGTSPFRGAPPVGTGRVMQQRTFLFDPMPSGETTPEAAQRAAVYAATSLGSCNLHRNLASALGAARHC